MLRDQHFLIARQEFACPTVHDLAVPLQRALDSPVIQARQDERDIVTGQRLIAPVEGSSVGDPDQLAIGIVGVEVEKEFVLASWLDDVGGAEPRASMLILEEFRDPVPKCRGTGRLRWPSVLSPQTKYHTAKITAKRSLCTLHCALPMQVLKCMKIREAALFTCIIMRRIR